MTTHSVPEKLRLELAEYISRIGVTDAAGRSGLNEARFAAITDFKVVVRPNEGQHRGRPHCVVQMDRGAPEVSVDILTGEILAGNPGPWRHTITKAILEHSAALKDFWDSLRPDDQRLPDRA